MLDLTESNPTKCEFKSLDVLSYFGKAPSFRYEPDPRGLLKAREAVCLYYSDKKINVHPDDVFLTCGTSEAYSILFHLLCDMGEEVLCQSPTYPLLDHLAAYAGITARRFDVLPADIGKAKAVVVVNPANPTGLYVDQSVWGDMERYCEKHALSMISDEVFFEFDWRNHPRISGASRSSGLHFTLNGVSKMLGLPQMKIAWIVLSGPEKERREAAVRLEAVADAFLSVNTPSQNALSSWLGGKDVFIREMKDRLRMNFESLRNAIKRPIPEPEGGWYALVPVPEGRSDEDLALRLLEKQNVLVYPGYFFDLEKESLVVSLLPEPALFARAAMSLSLI